jgi:hypothetical protein
MNDLGRLVGHGSHHTRVRMAQRIHAEAGHQVKIAVAGGIIEIDPLAMVHDDGKTSVNGKQRIRIAVENTLGVGILPEVIHDLFI